MKTLARMKCEACRGDVPRVSGDEAASLAAQVPAWAVVNGHHLHRTVATDEFLGSLKLANRIGAVAEKAGHHPDLLVAWGRLGIDIYTHKIDGLTKNDFILAAKIDEVLAGGSPRLKRKK